MEIKKKADETEAEFIKRLLDIALVDELTKARVTIPERLEAAKAMFKGLISLVLDGDTGKPMVGDKDLATVIVEWAKSDEGKHFVTAQNNSGGGAPGGSRGRRERLDEKLRADWELWASIPRCTPRQAVALSLDLEPPEHSHQVRGWPAEYERRLKITDAHIEAKNILGCFNTPSKSTINNPCTVDLTAYSAWAQSLGWLLPDRFPREVEKPTNVPADDACAPAAAKVEAELDITRSPATTTHKIQTRAQPLDAEIKVAKEHALDKNSSQSVWDALVKMADSKEGCLLGQGNADEIKYGSSADTKIFTKKMLGDRMRRSIKTQ